MPGAVQCGCHRLLCRWLAKHWQASLKAGWCVQACVVQLECMAACLTAVAGATLCVCLQVWEGAGVVASARKLIGATNPLAAEPGTIRGDFAIEVGRNIVHGSDSPENGERETGA